MLLYLYRVMVKKKSLGLVQSFVSGLKQQICNIILHNDVEDVLNGGLEVTYIT